jgi:RNA polymerase sigma-70 factor (ECF subfamily)
MVFSLAYHFLHDGSLAEDLAQEVFLQLYHNLSKIESPSHLLFWLRRVTCHRCIDWARRHHARPLFSLEEAGELLVPASSADPMLSRTLLRLVGSLPEKPRLILTLRFQEDLLPAEIAKILGMPVNSVKRQLQRSLTLLQEKFAALQKVPV